MSVSEKSPLLAKGEHNGDGTSQNTHNTLGTLQGCFIPCTLNIMGIILFVRLSFGVGQAGILGMLGVFALSETMALLTVLSLSAIVTNGKMMGGGTYFLVSRSLGPELGGAIGILFYIAYVVGAAFYIQGFTYQVATTWLPLCGPDPAVSDGFCVEGEATLYWAKFGVASACLLFVFAVAVVGANTFAKFNIFFFVLQMASILIGLVSMYIPHKYGWKDTVDAHANDTYTYNQSGFPNHFVDNLYPDYSDSSLCVSVTEGGQMCSYQRIFAIMFPAVTGIMEGANLSGDLKRPSYSIPRGTLMAMGSALVSYVILILSLGATFPREVLKTDPVIMQHATVGTQYFIVVGFLISAVSSALGSLFGASRVLQAVAKDEIYPGPLKVFAYGSKVGDEPRMALVLTYLLCQSLLFIDGLDMIDTIATNFFCLSYSLCNLTCLLLELTGAPNHRPTWKWYSWHTAALGFLLNVAVMFFLNWVYALASWALLFILFVTLVYIGPSVEWGDVSQALMYHQVRKYLLRLDPNQHAKFWRPSIMVLVNSVKVDSAMHVLNGLKKGGLLVLGHIIQGEVKDLTSKQELLTYEWQKIIKKNNIKAFPQVTIAKDPRIAYEVLVASCGLGGMNTNTIALQLFGEHDCFDHPYVKLRPDAVMTNAIAFNTSTHAGDHRNYDLPLRSPLEYCQLLENIKMLKKNIIINCNIQANVDDTASVGASVIDVWVFASAIMDFERAAAGGVTNGNAEDSFRQALYSSEHEYQFDTREALLLQFGYILRQTRRSKRNRKKGHRLRLFYVEDMGSNVSEDVIEERLLLMCEHARLGVTRTDIKVFTIGASLLDTLPVYRTLCAETSNTDTVQPKPLDAFTDSQRCDVLNALIVRSSFDATNVFMDLPRPPKDAMSDPDVANYYLECLEILTEGVPMASLVACSECTTYISTDL